MKIEQRIWAEWRVRIPDEKDRDALLNNSENIVDRLKNGIVDCVDVVVRKDIYDGEPDFICVEVSIFSDSYDLQDYEPATEYEPESGGGIKNLLVEKEDDIKDLISLGFDRVGIKHEMDKDSIDCTFDDAEELMQKIIEYNEMEERESYESYMELVGDMEREGGLCDYE